MPRSKILIMGAAGRDFHNFNVVFRGNPHYEVVAFTAAQIPNIEGRRYPPELAGELYPEGIPIFAETELERLIDEHTIDQVVFSYSDVSPLAQAIVEVDAIRQLFDSGVIVIAAGGGGIPVCVEQDGSYRGVEAVVDKDFASSLLALKIGVTKIIDLTGVDYVKMNFASPQESDLKTMSVAEAKRHLADGHFLPGSMGPKIEAAIDFLEHGGREVIVTLPEHTLDAFLGRAGTHVYPDALAAIHRRSLLKRRDS